jgi:hypothetical protein
MGAAKLGTAAGAVAWVAPQLTSVAYAQDLSGTAVPSTSGPGGTVIPPGTGPGELPNSEPEEPSSLPFTGAYLAEMALAGGAAVAAGRTLMLARRKPQNASLDLDEIEGEDAPGSPAPA